MTKLNLLGLCECYFNALECFKRGENLSEEQRRCLSQCNARYNPEINNCNPKPISLEKFKELQERFPGSYLF